RYTRSKRDWSSDVCSSDLEEMLDLSANHEDFVEYQDYSKDIEDLVDKIERPSKMNALLQLVDQIVSESKTAIVWCIFIRTMYKQIGRASCRERVEITVSKV